MTYKKRSIFLNEKRNDDEVRSHDSLAERLEVSRPTAQSYVEILEDAGKLRRTRFGRSNLYYIPDFISLL